MLDKTVVKAAVDGAGQLGCEVAALLAVIEVESAGKIFATVDGRPEPLIRFEGHYFDKRLTDEQRAVARARGLAHPSAGKVKNPAGQPARWAMLERAKDINRQAALESCSWGAGQVMGSHWKWLGFASVDVLVSTARAGARGQVDLIVRYIVKAGLADELKRRDWAGFARGYNGPAYAKHGYHTKIAKAYTHWLTREPAFTPSAEPKPAIDATGAVRPPSLALLRMGARGEAVTDLQTLLRRAGHALTVDGDFGPSTREAVRAFQHASSLDMDGIAGRETLAALERYRQAASPAVEKHDRLVDLIVAGIWSMFK